jgi:hypothetical protein
MRLSGFTPSRVSGDHEISDARNDSSVEWRSTGHEADGTPKPEFRDHFDRIKP